MQNMGYCGIIALIVGLFLLLGFAFIIYLIIRAVYKSREQIAMMRASRPIPLEQLKKEARELENEPRYVELYGKAECFFPIKTSMSKTEVICYELKVEQIWHEPGHEKESKVMKMEEFFLSAPFQLTDQSGTIEMKIDSHLILNVETSNSSVFGTPQDIKTIAAHSDSEWKSDNSAGKKTEEYWDDYDREYGYIEDGGKTKKSGRKNKNLKRTGFRYTETYILPGTELNMMGYLTFSEGRFYLKSGEELCFISDKPKEIIVLELDKDRSRNFGCLVLIFTVTMLTGFLFAGITQWFWETGAVVFNLIFLIIAYFALSSLLILTHFEVFWEDLRKVGGYVSDYFIK